MRNALGRALATRAAARGVLDELESDTTDPPLMLLRPTWTQPLRVHGRSAPAWAAGASDSSVRWPVGSKGWRAAALASRAAHHLHEHQVFLPTWFASDHDLPLGELELLERCQRRVEVSSRDHGGEGGGQ